MNKLSKGQKIYVTSKSSGELIMVDEVVEILDDIVMTKNFIKFEKEFEHSIFCLDPGTRKLYNCSIETPQLKSKEEHQKLVHQLLNKNLFEHTP